MASKTRRSSDADGPVAHDDGADDQDRESREPDDDVQPPPNERLLATHRATLTSPVAPG